MASLSLGRRGSEASRSTFFFLSLTRSLMLGGLKNAKKEVLGAPPPHTERRERESAREREGGREGGRGGAKERERQIDPTHIITRMNINIPLIT